MSVVAAAFLTEDTAATIKQAPAGVAGRAFSPLPAILLVYSVPGSAVPAAPRPEAVQPSAQIGIPAPEHACRYDGKFPVPSERDCGMGCSGSALFPQVTRASVSPRRVLEGRLVS